MSPATGSMRGQGTPVSIRMDAEVVAALKAVADERGESMSDTVRRASLLLLGKCPTCGQQIAAAQPAPS